MSDNKKQVGKPDRDRIGVSQKYEVEDWLKKFGVTPDELKAAAKSVGPMAKDVEDYLKRINSYRGISSSEGASV
jgi:hypothetical protein